jgi:heptosyltransferase-3
LATGSRAPVGLFISLFFAANQGQKGNRGYTLEVLIIRPGALGDTLMALPALVNLKEKASVAFAGREPGLGFIRDYVRESWDLERSGWHMLFMKRPFRGRLPVSKTDLVVAFFGDKDGRIRRNLRTLLPRVPVHVFPSFPPENADIHVAQHVAQCLKAAGLPVEPKAALEAARGAALIGGTLPFQRGRSIVFHPGSGTLKKNFPLDFWLDLIRRAQDVPFFKGEKATLLLGPAEEPVCAFFAKNLGPYRTEIVSCPDKTGLTSLLRGAGLYVGHDSGVTHLAAMLGTPTVALFKESRVEQWAPLGPAVRVIQTERPDPELILTPFALSEIPKVSIVP